MRHGGSAKLLAWVFDDFLICFFWVELRVVFYLGIAFWTIFSVLVDYKGLTEVDKREFLVKSKCGFLEFWCGGPPRRLVNPPFK